MAARLITDSSIRHQEAGPLAQSLEIRIVRRDGDTQSRLALQRAVVMEYAELMRSGVTFPPVTTWFDGSQYWLSDGFHRVAAAEEAGQKTINAVVVRGTLEDARWDCYCANSSHGLRRSRADLKALIFRALQHPKAFHLSNNQLAQHLQIPEATLRRWRNALSSSTDEDRNRIAVRKGTTYEIRTGNIGHKRSPGPDRGTPLRDRLRELAIMKDLAPSDVLPCVLLFEKWIAGRISVAVCLEGLGDALKTHTGNVSPTFVRGR
jgi:hypothetical protein